MNWKQFDWLIKLMHLFYFYSFFLLLTVCFFVKCYNAGTSNSAPLVCYLITILLIGVSSGSSQVVSVSRGVSMTTCSLKWCLNHSFTLTSVVFKPHFSLCQMLSKARGSWWAQSNSVTVRYPAVPRVCMCVSSLCLYLETGKVCRSKSLRKAALIPSCVASTWNGCKWTNGNQPLFFPLSTPTASDKRREVLSRKLEIWSSDEGFVGVHIFCLNCLAGLIRFFQLI